MRRLSAALALGIALVPSAALAEAVPAQATVSDMALERLATAESRLPLRLSRLIYNDPTMRAEIRRVGFEKGCRAVADSRREVSRRFVPELVPATVAAIRKIVPEPRLSEMRPRSFVIGALKIYAGRIDAEIDRSVPDVLTAAYEAMRNDFLERMRGYPNSENPADNVVMPRPDIAAAIGLGSAYDLDNPAHLGMACADFLISPSIRPTITTSPGPPVFKVLPPSK